jgi:hypothetical protein
MTMTNLDRSELDRRFRTVLTGSAAQRLGRRTGKGANFWRNGACLVLASAVLAWLGEDPAIALWQLKTSRARHLFVRAGESVIDGGGIVAYAEFLQVWSEAGQVDFALADLQPVSLAQAEQIGVEFDDWATERLTAQLRRAISPTVARRILLPADPIAPADH